MASPDLLGALRRLHAAVESLQDAAAAAYGINRTDLRCLELLDRLGPVTAGHLAQSSGLSPAAVTKLLVRLERAHLVTVQVSPQDNRRHLITRTDRHRHLAEAIWRPVQDEVAAAVMGLSEAEAQQLQDLLDVMTDISIRRRDQLSRVRQATPIPKCIHLP